MSRTQMVIFLIVLLVAFTVISALVNARKIKRSKKMNPNGIMLLIRSSIRVERVNGVKNPGFGYSNDKADPYIYVYLKPGENNLLLKYISKTEYVLSLACKCAFFAGGIRREITFFAEENNRYQVEFNPDTSEFVISTC